MFLWDLGRSSAEAGATLNHPGLEKVIDRGTTSLGNPFLVHEMIEAPTFAKRIEAVPPWSIHEVVRVGTSMLDALAVAHAAGLVHGDLEPERVQVAVVSASFFPLRLLATGPAPLVDVAAEGRAGLLDEPLRGQLASHPFDAVLAHHREALAEAKARHEAAEAELSRFEAEKWHAGACTNVIVAMDIAAPSMHCCGLAALTPLTVRRRHKETSTSLLKIR